MASTAPPLLHIEDIVCKYEEKTLIRNISFHLNEGDCLVVVGKSGSGKSTLLKCLAHLNIYEGTITYRGKAPLDHGIANYRTKVQYVPQRPSILPGTPRSFLETILTFRARQGHGIHSSHSDDPVELAERWGVDGSAWDRAWSSLSGGEVQRVALALAVGLPGAEILLLDEPTSALDAETSIAVEKYLLGLLHSQSSLKALVWITHSHEQGQRVATRHLLMETGGTISHLGV